MSQVELEKTLFKEPPSGDSRYEDGEPTKPIELETEVRGVQLFVGPELFEHAHERLGDEIKPSQEGTPGEEHLLRHRELFVEKHRSLGWRNGKRLSKEDIENEEREEESVHHRPQVDVRADVVSVGREKSVAYGENEVHDKELAGHTTKVGERGKLFTGLRVSGKSELLQAGVGAHGGVSVGKDGVRAGVEAKAEVNLLKLEYEGTVFEFAYDLMGEEVAGKVYVKVEGQVGADVKAALEANVGKGHGLVEPTPASVPKLHTEKLVEGTGFEVDEGKGVAKPKKMGAGAQGSVEFFAGARFALGAGAAIEWKKKDASEYHQKVRAANHLLLDMIGALAGPSGMALVYLLREMDADKSTEWLLEHLLEWGKPGTFPLFAIEQMVEGSAGIGGKLMAQIGFTGSRYVWNVTAKGTLGLGVGESTKVTLDLLEGGMFALLVLGQLEEPARQYLEKKVDQIALEAVELPHAIEEWYYGDVKVREMVKHDVHRLAPPARRATMISTLMDGYCSADDEKAIAAILQFSSSNGDLSEVLSGGGGKSFIELSRERGQALTIWLRSARGRDR